MSTWILLRGLAREARHWGDFPACLASRLGGARIIAIDLPGNGARHAQASPLRMAALTDAARRELAAQGIAAPYHLLALSLGAMVAVDWATRRPDEVAGAVLINTSLRGLNPLHHRLRPANYARLLRLVVATDDVERERTILALTSRQPGGTPAADALVERWCAIRRASPVSAHNAVRQLVCAARFRAPEERPRVPVLLLSSRGDALVDPRCSLRLAALWQVPHAIHPGAGHDLPLDDGEWVADAIAGWLTHASV